MIASLPRGMGALLVLCLLLLSGIEGRPFLPRSHPHSHAAPPRRRARVAAHRLKPLHLVLSRQRERLKVFDGAGRLIFTCKAKNETVGIGFLHFGACPPGDYGLAAPVPCGTPPFGPYFIPLVDLSPTGPFHRYRRHAIGIHGGGSGLPRPLARWQGWCRTRGCFRLQNINLIELVRLLRTVRKEKQCTLAHGQLGSEWRIVIVIVIK